MPKRTNDGLKKRCAHKRKTWSDCACAWWFGFHCSGREYRYSLTKLAAARQEPPPRSKDDAIVWRDRLRAEIRGGTFVDPDVIVPIVETPAALPTFGDVCDEYLKRHVRIPTRKPAGTAAMEGHVALLRRAEIPAAHGETVTLGAKPITAVTKADIEAVRTWRRQQQVARVGQSRPHAKGGEAGINRLLSRLRHLLSWSVAEGYLTDTPFRRGSVTVVKLVRGVENARTRRLEPGEEARLLQHATPHLRALIVAALTTGCRLGELLSLQWSQIRRDERGEARWLVLEAAKTKTSETRAIPIGPRLRAELEMRRHAPDGKEHKATAYIFGNDTGEQIGSIRRAWETAVLYAHGHTPLWIGKGKLSPESRETLKAIDLHFHDLRRQFACTLLESGADLHDVRDFLGHAAITTTSRYLQSTPLRLEKALARMEAGGFAHHSHTEAPEAPATTPESDAANRPNLLN
ncbi:MAG: tyrosine-type recombinase/integrase [Vicinamibacterales bacterium]